VERPKCGAAVEPRIIVSWALVQLDFLRMEETPSLTNSMTSLEVQDLRLESKAPTPPALPRRTDKRALLLVYIHGFKGDETSFKELPTVTSTRPWTDAGPGRVCPAKTA
jgi:hypothetical protein